MTNCPQCGTANESANVPCRQCGLPLAGATITYATDSLPPGDSVRTYYPTASSDSEPVDRLLADIAAQSHFEERYKLLGELARGGMGAIHRANDSILRREVAVKMMREDSAESAAVRGQFLKEGRIGGWLLHPNVLPVFDLGVNRQNQIYYTMRLVKGASLQANLEAVEQAAHTKLITYPLRRLVEAFVGVCRGVDYAHERGVIHLDLKPANVLMSGFNEVFVIDWGLARVGDDDDTERLIDLYHRSPDGRYSPIDTGVHGAVIGTPLFMAPEQTRGDVGHYTPATDVYGLGGILHFILYGTGPNQGEGIAEILMSASKPKQKGKLRSGLMPRGQRVLKDAQMAVETLEAICLKALEPEQERRYQSADEMVVELCEWLTATPGPPKGF